jgi:hypothetical protein
MNKSALKRVDHLVIPSEKSFSFIFTYSTYDGKTTVAHASAADSGTEMKGCTEPC